VYDIFTFVMNPHSSYEYCLPIMSAASFRSVRLSHLSEFLEFRFGNHHSELGRKFGFIKKIFQGQILELKDVRSLSNVKVVR
jgi:hypothetical protein